MTERNINVVLQDALHYARTKPKNVILFKKGYLTDGSKPLIEDQLAFCYEDVVNPDPIVPGSPGFSQETDPDEPNIYCENDENPTNPQMTGIFIQYYMTPELIADGRAVTAFRSWFRKVCMDWMNVKNLRPKVKSPEVVDAYLEKIIGNYSIPTT